MMKSGNPGTRIVTKIIFPVANMSEATAFYIKLGFEVENYDSGYAWVTNAGDEVLHLQLVADLDRDTNHSSGYFHVQDVDRWHAAWTGADVDVSALENQPWQMREFSLRDPSGNVLRVGQNL